MAKKHLDKINLDKMHLDNIHSKGMLRALYVIAAILLNVILGYIAKKLGTPLYWDSIGVISVAAIGGVFPGIITAVMSSLFCMFFRGDALYFVVINIMVAFCVAKYSEKYEFKDIKRIAPFVLMLGFACGVLNAIIQWGIYDGPQNADVDRLVTLLEERLQFPRFFIFILVSISIGILEYSISMILSLLIIKVIPKNIKKKINESGWRQKPLSRREVKSMTMWGSNVKTPIRKRFTYMMASLTMVLIIVMIWIAVTLYFNIAKQDKIEDARNMAYTIAESLDSRRVGDVFITGESGHEYKEVENVIKRVKRNTIGITKVYVCEMKDYGYRYVVDIGNADEKIYSPGDKVAYEEKVKKYLPDFKEGKEVGPVEFKNNSNKEMSLFCPILDEEGNCSYYVGVDMSLDYMAKNVAQYIFKSMLIILGFFFLIISFTIWVTGYYMVYPINSIASCVDGFIDSGENQELMDEHVKKLRHLNIKTGDEIEKMYYSLCKMAAGMSEQIRDIRHYTDSTAKMQNGLIITMADMVENRDSDTGAHIQKTAAYVRIILDGLKAKGYYIEKLTPKYMADVEMSAPLHDVGKINIPDAVLNKPGKLTDEEYEIMKTHTTMGKIIMEKAISSVRGENYLKEARNMAAYHHERWDGNGYPEKLHGEIIPLSARIMAVADVFDALTSARVYKPAFPLEKALDILREGAGTQFDPKCVEVFMDSLDEVKKVLRKYQDS